MNYDIIILGHFAKDKLVIRGVEKMHRVVPSIMGVWL